METTSLFIQKVGVVLSGAMSYVTVSDAEKLHALKVGARILLKGKIYSSSRDVASLIKNLNETGHQLGIKSIAKQLGAGSSQRTCF